MSNVTVDLTVGDDGVTVSGVFSHTSLTALSSLAGCSMAFSLLSVPRGAAIVNLAAATMGAFSQAAGTIQVSYRLQAADVAAVRTGQVRWRLTLPDGGHVNSPGPQDAQTFLRFNR